jgi:16S rRNA pseudouridine516 synthase
MSKKLRLDKLLAHMGFGSRSELKRLAKSGDIRVNGKAVKDSGLQVDPAVDRITVHDDEVRYREFVYLMLHKPPGVVSATEDSRDRTVIDLLSDEYKAFEPFPVGRLDKDTEGLLLLTNDGKLAHNLLSPRKHVPKTYYAHVAGSVGEDDIRAFEAGVTLDDGYTTLPAQLHIVQPAVDNGDGLTRIELTITEGKFHQVKRMFEAVGKKVVYLKRLSMGPLKLDPELPIGSARELTEAELEALQAHGTGPVIISSGSQE